ncbi:MAG: TrkA family potassium uptake protein [Ruminococcus sp.]|nr:TrkA family potassium uptake protein [Ruminococcus sp.]MCM1382628.1 TrkA family potassium uptake protein [Muribaculaceae bacterium]MCM1479184.1 TrkA family potassium uptake protein [Muribaculaceae bacterium]
MKVTIVGGGKVGYYLVRTLIEHGHEPTVIETNRLVCEKIANEMDIPMICGDAARLDVLESADAAHSDAVVSVTGSDETNLIVCQLARKKFGVPKTAAKCNNPKNVAVMEALGIDHVINSTDSIASLIEREVDTSRIKQILSLNKGEVTLFEVELPPNYAYDGKMLMDVKLPVLFNIVSITRRGCIIIPRGQSMLKSGDKLLVISETNAVKEIKSSLKIKE